MTKMLQAAIEKMKSLPEDRQEEVGEVILSFVEPDSSTIRLSDAQESEVRLRMAKPGPTAMSEETDEAFRNLIG